MAVWAQLEKSGLGSAEGSVPHRPGVQFQLQPGIQDLPEPPPRSRLSIPPSPSQPARSSPTGLLGLVPSLLLPHPSPGLPVHFLFALRALHVSSCILAISWVPPPQNISPPSLVVSCPRAAHPAHPHTQCAFLLIGCALPREQAAWRLVTGPGPHGLWLAGQVVRNGGLLLSRNGAVRCQ